MRRWTIIGTALLVAMAACSSADLAENVIEQSGDVGNIEIDENDGTVVIEIQDDDGDTSAVIGGGDVPDDFPIPVPDGGNVMAVVTQGVDTSLSITYPQDQFENLKDFYSDYASNTGEVLVTFESADPPGASWTIQTDNQTFSISVGDTGTEVSVALVVVTSG